MSNTMRLWVMMIIMGLPPGAYSQDIYRLDLLQSQAYALDHNISVQAMRKDVEASKLKVRETLAIGLPQVQGNMSYQNFIKQPVSLIPAEFFGGKPGEFAEITFGTKQNASASVQASQLLFDGSYIVGLQTTHTFLNMNKLNMEKTKKEIVERVKQAYASVLLAEENRDILAKNLVFLKKNLSESEAMLQNGLIEEQDVEQIKLLLSEMKDRLLTSARQVSIAYYMLKIQLGMDLSDSLVLTDSLKHLISGAIAYDFKDLTFVPAGNVDVKLIENKKQLAVLNMRNEKMKLYPTISAFVSHQQDAYREEFDFFQSVQTWFPTTIWGINITVPIFSSFMRYTKIREAKYDLEKTELMKKQVEQNIRLQEMNARSDFQNNIALYKSAKQSVDLARRIRDKTAIKYKEGLASSLELTQSESQLLNAQQKYVLGAFNLLKSKAAFERIVNQ